jgi:acyl-CoA thioesterase
MAQDYLSWLLEYYKEIYQTPILENFLGLEIVELIEGKSIFCTKTTEKYSNMYGTVHGGTLASISDIVMGASCITLGKKVVTIDMNTSYIKSVPSGSILTATAEVISNGNTIMRAVGEILDENNQLLARSQASYFVIGDFKEDVYLRLKSNDEIDKS